MRAACIRSVILISTILTGLSAQPAVTNVPKVVRVSSAFVPADGGKPATVEGVTLSIYRDGKGGAPLWQETQNVSMDSEGRYSVLLGTTVNDGLPMELFISGEPRWLGVRFNRPGETEQPRTLLASVPYALRASDAETLGGLPASAFLRDAAASPSSPAASSAAVANLTPNGLKPRVTSGTAGYIGMFTDATDLGNSVLYQYGSRIGVNDTLPADYMHVAFTDSSGVVTGYAVQNLGSGAKSYSGMLFYDQNGNLGQFQGFNNSTHEYRINNIAPNGTINFMIGSASKFLVANSGNIGIGTAMPGANLDVVGNINLSGNLLAASTPVLFLTQASSGNIGLGYSALVSNTSGTLNTAIGNRTLTANTTGNDNTAVGYQALINNTGNSNIAIGTNAGESLNGGASNIYIGADLPSAPTPSSESNTTRIGFTGQTRTFIGGISGTTTGLASGATVVVDTNGQLGTVLSSIRYKEDVRDMGHSSDGLLKLRPVTYRYKQPYEDGSKPLDYGLIAEEVNEIYPDLVVKDRDGQVQTVQYQKLVPMLLNELQKLQGRVAALEGLLSSQKAPDADGLGQPAR